MNSSNVLIHWNDNTTLYFKYRQIKSFVVENILLPAEPMRLFPIFALVRSEKKKTEN